MIHHRHLVSVDDVVTITSTILYIIATRWAWIACTCDGVGILPPLALDIFDDEDIIAIW
jgi:hypothetical protein